MSTPAYNVTFRVKRAGKKDSVETLRDVPEGDISEWRVRLAQSYGLRVTDVIMKKKVRSDNER